jgi:hypothetical protein
MATYVGPTSRSRELVPTRFPWVIKKRCFSWYLIVTTLEQRYLVLFCNVWRAWSDYHPSVWSNILDVANPPLNVVVGVHCHAECMRSSCQIRGWRCTTEASLSESWYEHLIGVIVRIMSHILYRRQPCIENLWYKGLFISFKYAQPSSSVH